MTDAALHHFVITGKYLACVTPNVEVYYAAMLQWPIHYNVYTSGGCGAIEQ